TTHPRTGAVTTWGDLQDYAAYDPAGRDLQPLVDLVDAHGADAILAAVAHHTPEDQCEVTVSTAHQAKGREWAQVKIADDFTPPSDGPPDGTGLETVRRVDDKEACLAYVAVTRTRHRLDIGGLSWINEHPEGASAGSQLPR
ncbi:3'-5' exonuclease, partial [Streptomyces nigra]|uniref:3'-5' exonuclease n=1 Tax=Streptomyces nigra TaxID=1827580 RepID=UPI0036A92B91